MNTNTDGLRVLHQHLQNTTSNRPGHAKAEQPGPERCMSPEFGDDIFKIIEQVRHGVIGSMGLPRHIALKTAVSCLSLSCYNHTEHCTAVDGSTTARRSEDGSIPSLFELLQPHRALHRCSRKPGFQLTLGPRLFSLAPVVPQSTALI